MRIWTVQAIYTINLYLIMQVQILCNLLIGIVFPKT